MAAISEIERLAFDLPDSDRALLAAHLLRSLPSVLHDDDEGMAEALCRDAELDAGPDTAITLEQLDQRIARDEPLDEGVLCKSEAGVVRD